LLALAALAQPLLWGLFLLWRVRRRGAPAPQP